MKQWKIGVVGCGMIAQTVYLPQIKRLNNANVVAVYDIDGKRAKEVADLYDVPNSYDNLDDFLASDIEIVMSVAAIQGRHEVNMKALAAGKHLYSQKPFAPTVEAATEQIELAKKMGVKLSAAPVHRNRPEIKKAQRLIKKGAIGKLSLMKIDVSHGGPEYFQFRDTDPSWFYKPGAGALYDLGVHAVDQTIAMMGPAKYVTCVAAISEPTRTIRSGALDGKVITANEVPDNYIIILEFENGALAEITTGFVQKASRVLACDFQVFGNRGTIHVDGGVGFEGVAQMEIYSDDPQTGVRGWTVPDAVDIPDTNEWFQAQVITDLINAIENDCQPALYPEHARHVIEILNAVEESIETGKKVELKTTC